MLVSRGVSALKFYMDGFLCGVIKFVKGYIHCSTTMGYRVDERKRHDV